MSQSQVYGNMEVVFCVQSFARMMSIGGTVTAKPRCFPHGNSLPWSWRGAEGNIDPPAHIFGACW